MASTTITKLARIRVEKGISYSMVGTLFVVATPICNLADMVPRAVAILPTVVLVAAEDTRHSGRLLAHFNIDTPLVAYHEHSAPAQGERILATLACGQNVALISDVGTKPRTGLPTRSAISATPSGARGKRLWRAN